MLNDRHTCVCVCVCNVCRPSGGPLLAVLRDGVLALNAQFTDYGQLFVYSLCVSIKPLLSSSVAMSEHYFTDILRSLAIVKLL